MDTFCSAHITNRAIVLHFNPVKPSGYYMYRQWSLYVPPVVTICTARFNIHKFYVLPTQCIYVSCVDLRTNSDYSPIPH